jgi:pilus assembly protein Flp/PilA
LGLVPAPQAGGCKAAAGKTLQLDHRARPRREREQTMKNFALKVRQFLVSEDGPTAVEYAVMLALIVIVCLVSIQAIGTNANVTFNSIATAMPTGS